MDEIHKVIIIGGGPAGYTAGLYAARAELKPLLIAGYQAGGQLMLTSEVENFPGFRDGILGPKLMEEMRLQAERFGTKILNEDVTEVDFSNGPPFTIKTYDNEYKGQSIIISTGASARWLGLESEQKLIGSGVSSCATCDGAFFKEKVVVTIGGGDSAMEEALFLTRYASKVSIIHRREVFKASNIMLTRAKEHPKIEFLVPYVVKDISSVKEGFVEKVTGITLENTESKETKEIEVDGVFVAIGHDPNTKIFREQIDMDEELYIQTHKHTMTNIPGVFAAGDVVDKRYRQAITAAGDGCRAAIDATRWLEDKGIH
jgi:thioredoxin reductase (NADPH)